MLNPQFKGKSALINVPSIGIMDAAMAIELSGEIKYGDKGNQTKAEIDKTIEILTKAKKNGQFRAFWTDFNESVNLMASGEVVIQSMWSPAVTAVRSKGIKCDYVPLAEGYRGWCTGFALPRTLCEQEAGRRLRIHQLVPGRLGRRLFEPAGLLPGGAVHDQKGPRPL